MRRVDLLPVLLLAACGAKTPREGWSDAWGPLVPHETFPADCGLCHTSERWDALRDDFRFDHEAETGVPLRGAHEEAACLRCHNDYGPVASYAARGCAGCHADPHRAALGPDCASCHDESSWRARGVSAMHARTRLPLVGAHLAVACEQCHPAAPVGDYRNAPFDCAECHLADALAAVSFDHQAGGFTASCERCHYPTTWSAAGFRHDFFPLAGGHAGLACAECHGSGAIGPIASDCNSCHADDYAAAPDHVALDFPRTCQQCHGTTTWTGARFDHRFPLQGPHDLDCASCHTTGASSAFSCLECHEHNRTDTDDDHDEVGGYQYASSACVACHPTGRE